MRVVIGGSSGFLGTALRRHLRAHGHDVTALVRREPAESYEVQWDPHAGRLDPETLTGADAVLNLSGAPIAHWPWTAAYRRKLVDSRVSATRTLAEAVAAAADPRPALVSASGVNVYGGDRGDEILDEMSTPGTDTLGQLCQQWEAATGAAADAGARVVHVRTSPVLSVNGGMLPLMMLPFRLGLGARLGSGRQWFPSVSLADYLRAVTRFLTDAALSGPYNMVAPQQATNTDLTAALARHLHRPERLATTLAVPERPARLVLDGPSDLLFGSILATPARLLDAGFEFTHPDIDAQLAAAGESLT